MFHHSRYRFKFSSGFSYPSQTLQSYLRHHTSRTTTPVPSGGPLLSELLSLPNRSALDSLRVGSTAFPTACPARTHQFLESPASPTLSLGSPSCLSTVLTRPDHFWIFSEVSETEKKTYFISSGNILKFVSSLF